MTGNRGGSETETETFVTPSALTKPRTGQHSRRVNTNETIKCFTRPKKANKINSLGDRVTCVTIVSVSVGAGKRGPGFPRLGTLGAPGPRWRGPF